MPIYVTQESTISYIFALRWRRPKTSSDVNLVNVVRQKGRRLGERCRGGHIGRGK